MFVYLFTKQFKEIVVLVYSKLFHRILLLQLRSCVMYFLISHAASYLRSQRMTEKSRRNVKPSMTIM